MCLFVCHSSVVVVLLDFVHLLSLYFYCRCLCLCLFVFIEVVGMACLFFFVCLAGCVSLMLSALFVCFPWFVCFFFVFL